MIYISKIKQKHKYLFLLIILVCCGLACFKTKQTPLQINSAGKTISERFSAPAGYQRIVCAKNSFGDYLQQLPLKPHGSLVYYYNGEEKPNKVAAAVLDLDVGKKDLQQCADAVMRLRAEYLYKNKRYEMLHFNFTNGFNAEYNKWRNKQRISVNRNRVNWVSTNKESESYQSFREYLDKVFTYAGTASLAKELKSVTLKDMQIGDVLIKGGSPGHAVIVVDVAVNPKTNQKLFMIAQSYMPAQNIHVLINKNDLTISPWYVLDESAENIYTPEWAFGKDELKRF